MISQPNQVFVKVSSQCVVLAERLPSRSSAGLPDGPSAGCAGGTTGGPSGGQGFGSTVLNQKWELCACAH